MIDGFTVLIFGFCAAVAEEHGQTYMKIGYVSEDKCIVRMGIGDSHGQTLTINGHAVGVSMISEGGEISIDGQRFVIPKTDKV